MITTRQHVYVFWHMMRLTELFGWCFCLHAYFYYCCDRWAWILNKPNRYRITVCSGTSPISSDVDISQGTKSELIKCRLAKRPKQSNSSPLKVGDSFQNLLHVAIYKTKKFFYHFLFITKSGKSNTPWIFRKWLTACKILFLIANTKSSNLLKVMTHQKNQPLQT